MRPQIQYKAAPAFTMGIEGRTVTGVFAVHGNVDDGGDRSHPGVFGDFSVDGRRRVVHLWQHDASQPPPATIDRIFEVSAADLPPAVRAYAPDATGGVAVQRTYLETPRAEEVLAGLKAGAITEMSYAYVPTRWDYEESDASPWGIVRNIYQSELYDTSDVNWGMNPATSAEGRKDAGRPLAIAHDTVLAAVAAYTSRYQDLASLRAKEGRVLSEANRTRIKDAVTAMEQARAALQELLDATETGKGAPLPPALLWRARALAAQL